MDRSLRAIMVAVDYADLLAVTLPLNRHHFQTVTIVTTPADSPNVLPVAVANEAEVICTNAFTKGGAEFNKWAALEQGLNLIGRFGWLCLMDADVIWPQRVDLDLQVGQLTTPVRRMLDPLPVPFAVPPELAWKTLPIHPNLGEWAGYSQIFHASDPALPLPPWHEIDWRHAGGADSFFQQRWKIGNKVRPSWECLHLGPAGVNWYGRATRRLDGTEPEGAREKMAKIHEIWEGRRRRRGREELFGPEKLEKPLEKPVGSNPSPPGIRAAPEPGPGETWKGD